MWNHHPQNQQHHVFLFRHCVRSTNERQSLHNNLTAVLEGTEEEFTPSDFVNDTAPDWNTSEYQCTQTGMGILKGSGRFLFDLLAKRINAEQKKDGGKNSNNNNSSPPRPPRIRLQVVADESQRDIDTAFALFDGLYEQMMNTTANPNGIELLGLHELTYDRMLFQPFDGEKGICEDPLSKLSNTNKDYQVKLQQELQARLDAVPPPDPGLSDTLLMIQQVGGKGKRGSVTDIPSWIPNTGEEQQDTLDVNTTSPFPVVVSKEHAANLAGPVNMIKWIAQMAFYSRAGGVQSPYLWNVTVPQLYKLVEWIHWSRTITDVDNTVAAAKGSVLARAVLDALRYGSLPVTGNAIFHPRDEAKCIKEDDVDATVTLIIGHDGDLDSVATALGVRWRLESPYHTTSPANARGEYVPTPPGSALHFEYQPATGSVEMQFLYPIYLYAYNRGLTTNSTDIPRIPRNMQLNTTGILEETPLILKPRTVSIEDTVQLALSADTKRMILRETGLDVFEAQLAATLKTFPEALDCYESYVDLIQRVEEQTKHCGGLQTGGGTDGAGMSIVGVLSLLVAVAATLCIIWCRLRQRRQRSSRNIVQGTTIQEEGGYADHHVDNNPGKKQDGKEDTSELAIQELVFA